MVCDGNEVLDNEVVSFALEFPGCVSGGLLLDCCAVVTDMHTTISTRMIKVTKVSYVVVQFYHRDNKQ